MKSLLIIALMAATAIATPVKKDFPNPYPDYKGDLEVLVRNFSPSHLPKLTPELQKIINKKRLPAVDRQDGLYIPLPEAPLLIKKKVIKTLSKFDDLKVPNENSPDIYLYRVSTSNDSKFKRYHYSDLALNLYVKA